MSKQKDEKDHSPYQTIEFEVKKDHYSMNPSKFMLWMSLGGSFIIFSGLMAAYLIMRMNDAWLSFSVPSIFYFSTILLLASSGTLYWAEKAAIKDDIEAIKKRLWLTFGLSLAFVLMQWNGWTTLFNQDLDLSSNVSVAFLYIISGIHALHVVGGSLYLGRVLFLTHRNQIHSKNMQPLQLFSTYWHFIDLLWIYLLVFLLLFR